MLVQTAQNLVILPYETVLVMDSAMPFFCIFAAAMLVKLKI